MTWALATTLVGGIATLAIFSFIFKENWLYRFFEHLFVGIASGWGVLVTLKNFLWPVVISPLLGLDRVQYPDGTWTEPYNNLYLLYLIPICFGLFYYTSYSARYSWLAKLVIGLSLGASAGLAFEGFFNQMLPQLQSSFKPLIVFFDETTANAGQFDWFTSFNNALFVFTLLSVMYYFFFSFKNSSAILGKVSVSGRYLMMICFGAYFGSTVMARMALLVERLQFLIGPWFEALRQVVS
jgi:hypothetical protein